MRLELLVLLIRLELIRCCQHLILSQARLPIPPKKQSTGLHAESAARPQSVLFLACIRSFRAKSQT